ncbi:hypothetical protein ACWGJP_06890 [Microbacterium sp. NPDC055903]
MSDPQQSGVPQPAPQQPPYAAPQNGYPAQAPGYPTQPSYPGSAQAAPAGYPATPAYPAAGPTAGAGNGAGRAGLIIGIIGLALGGIFAIATQALLYSGSLGGYEAYGVVNGIGSVLSTLAAVVALILGIIGLRRRDAPRGAAGIATGLGIAGVFGGLFSFLLSALHTLMSVF